MARNRKHQAGSLRLVPALKALCLCLLLGGSAAGYVLQKNKLYELGRQITRREAELENLKRQNKLRAHQLAEMQLPHRLAERVKEQRLGLYLPRPDQVVWLTEPSRDGATNPAPPLLVLDHELGMDR
jgi:hypothetical protein